MRNMRAGIEGTRARTANTEHNTSAPLVVVYAHIIHDHIFVCVCECARMFARVHAFTRVSPSARA